MHCFMMEALAVIILKKIYTISVDCVGEGYAAIQPGGIVEVVIAQMFNKICTPFVPLWSISVFVYALKIFVGNYLIFSG